MPELHPDSPRPHRTRTKPPVATLVGIIGTALLALIGLLSGGFWCMLVLVALVALVTAAYGWIARRATWIRLARPRAAAILTAAALVVFLGSTSAFGATHPGSTTAAAPNQSEHLAAQVTASATPSPTRTHAATPKHTRKSKPKPTPSATPTPVITTQLVTVTAPIPFTTTHQSDSSLPQGQTTVSQRGANGVDTKTYTVTYSNGVETGRVLKTDVVTTQPVQQIDDVGTYVAPAPAPAPAAPVGCTNGTYVNSAGNTVCSPEVSSGAPAGATAKCVDGTYSFSQSRSGTCSRHGGVAAWL